MAEVTIDTNDQHVYSPVNWIQVGMVGLGVGVVVWVAAWLLGAYVTGPLLCDRMLHAGCGEQQAIAGNVAAVIGALAGTFGLTRIGVRRAIVVALAMLASLWGVTALYAVFSWYESLFWVALLYAIGYIAFAYIGRIRNILIMAVASIVLVLIARSILFL